jgi:hypothetical protein
VIEFLLEPGLGVGGVGSVDGEAAVVGDGSGDGESADEGDGSVDCETGLATGVTPLPADPGLAWPQPTMSNKPSAAHVLMQW